MWLMAQCQAMSGKYGDRGEAEEGIPLFRRSRLENGTAWHGMLVLQQEIKTPRRTRRFYVHF